MMYGLIGYPLGHSFSAGYFARKFEHLGLDHTYSPFPIPNISDLPALIAKHGGLKGFNVTIPYKEQVIPFLDSISDDASRIGAVNTVRIERNERGEIKLHGYNTDWEGFMLALSPIIGKPISSALILGTGGGAKGVAHALATLGIPYKFVSRTNTGGDTITYAELTKEVIATNSLIVNTTPLGMWPNIDTAPDIPYSGVTPEHICMDIVYNPAITKFMELCAQRGATVKNGLGMLHNQAELAWKIWSAR